MSENMWILEHFSEYFIKIFSAYVMSKHTAAPPTEVLVLVQENSERPNADLA